MYIFIFSTTIGFSTIPCFQNNNNKHLIVCQQMVYKCCSNYNSCNNKVNVLCCSTEENICKKRYIWKCNNNNNNNNSNTNTNSQQQHELIIECNGVEPEFCPLCCQEYAINELHFVNNNINNVFSILSKSLVNALTTSFYSGRKFENIPLRSSETEMGDELFALISKYVHVIERN
eukprot:Pgem_evm1s13354